VSFKGNLFQDVTHVTDRMRSFVQGIGHPASSKSRSHTVCTPLEARALNIGPSGNCIDSDVSYFGPGRSIAGALVAGWSASTMAPASVREGGLL
jgi:hypothetical protein